MLIDLISNRIREYINDIKELYGQIHQRFIGTPKGILKLFNKNNLILIK
jgi:hypothetical protein